ncbi:MAG: hypothetical protein ACYDCM_07330 [Candidatus Acidiferrales bacterium]
MEKKGKKRTGPKPLFGEVAAYRVSIILTESQQRAIQEVAAAEGKSASAWAREIVLAALPKEIK